MAGSAQLHAAAAAAAAGRLQALRERENATAAATAGGTRASQIDLWAGAEAAQLFIDITVVSFDARSVIPYAADRLYLRLYV